MNRRDPEPARLSYEPWRAQAVPDWLIPDYGVPWDTPGAWWLDCLVTYESRREQRIHFRIVPPPGVEVLKEAAQVLAGVCVESVIVCDVRPPTPIEEIQQIQEINAALAKERRSNRR